VLRRLVLIVAGMLMAALVAELALRTIAAVPEVANPLYSFHDSDPVLGWRGKADVRMRFRRPDFDALIEHGPDGWRRPEPPPPQDPMRRVLFLGDSFTWGWGVSQGEVFSDRLQRRLPPTTGVYNRGVNGFGTAQEFLLMRRELANRSYDAVALLFFVNDVADNVDGKRGRRPLFELDGDALVPRNQPPQRLINPLQRFFKDHSRAFQLLDFELGQLTRRPSDEEPTVSLANDATDVDFHSLPGAAVTMRLLIEMQRLAQAHHAQFVLVYVPHQGEIERGVSGAPYVRAVHALVDAVALAQGIPLVDLTDAFHAQAAGGAALVYPHDEHWTPAGHELAADVLLQSPLF
jgi:lysophospholipase L1-like esterase